jgi:hypothetical protein
MVFSILNVHKHGLQTGVMNFSTLSFSLSLIFLILSVLFNSGFSVCSESMFGNDVKLEYSPFT